MLCPGDAVANTTYSRSVITSVNVDAVYGVSCGPYNNTQGRQQWNLVLIGSGMYKQIETVICSVFPKITTVTVDYSINSKLSNSTSPNFLNSSQPVISSMDAPWLGDFANNIFIEGLTVGQGILGNSMGDSILAFWQALPNPAQVANEVIADYIRGVLELSGTLLRTAHAQEGNGLFPNGSSTPPVDMLVTTNGTHLLTTIGWHQDPKTSAGILVAPTFVCLMSMILILVVLIKKRHHPEPRANHYFDPGDILHIMSAATAGGLAHKLPSLNEKSVRNSDKMRIALAPVDGENGKPGFVLLDDDDTEHNSPTDPDGYTSLRHT